VSEIFLTPNRGSNPRPEECRRHPPTTRLKDLVLIRIKKKKTHGRFAHDDFGWVDLSLKSP
jgi:hypothetical protein